MRSIFVNLPVADVGRSRAFFTAMGFSFDDAFSDETTACLVVEQNIRAMLMTPARFADFVVGDVADATRSTEVLLCLSCESREEVDHLADTALASGGGAWTAAQDHGFMYGRSVTDPDGHVWELMWMDPSAVPA